MTAEEAIKLAEFQRPGVKLIVGAVEAREERTKPLPEQDLWERHRLDAGRGK